MASLYDIIYLELTNQAAKRYASCREDAIVKEGDPYVHPPVLHFSTSFSILPGSIESLKIDGLNNRRHRFSSIDSAAADLLSRCTGLRDLSLVYVQLNSFTGLPRFPLLKSLQMQGNQIDSFKGLLHQPSLQELNMWGNLLRGFKNFPALPNLRELNLSCNRIERQFERLVARAPRLSVLRLSLNPIEEEKELMHLEGLADLRLLEIYGCPVVERLLHSTSNFLQRMKAKGVVVILQQSRIPLEMLLQLQQMQEEHYQQQQRQQQQQQQQQQQKKLQQQHMLLPYSTPPVAITVTPANE